MSQEFKLATEMMGGGEGDDEVGVVEVYAEMSFDWGKRHDYLLK